ncbi:hypothetical protein C922_05584, partial [Plasmodium inui San Antonio 1]
MNFSNYITELLTNHTSGGQECHEDPESLKLCQLTKTATKNEAPIDAQRSEIWKHGYPSNLTSLDLRARMLCKAIEVWLSNLEAFKEGKRAYAPGSCKPEATGSLGGRRDEKKCPYSGEREVWRALWGTVPLYRSQEYQKNLRVCMDIMSIILT